MFYTCFTVSVNNFALPHTTVTTAAAAAADSGGDDDDVGSDTMLRIATQATLPAMLHTN